MATAVPDDVPWPELGNVSRGATRGNQGQKGVLGPPDAEGRSIIQLRVQPGVLQVRLNKQSTERYALLANEVNKALKLTKTYWRKARRRQDYDARADQDHMELHEWLQQLKDKTMAHLELLMQKGDITGPPYNMPDDMEITFLRKFVERQNAGLPHNPRLRNGAERALIRHNHISPTPEPTENYYPHVADFTVDRSRDIASSSRTSISPMLRNFDGLTPDGDVIQCARMALLQAQKQTQEAFMRYTACLDAERQAQQHVDEISKLSSFVSRSSGETLSSRSSVIDDRPTSPSRYEKVLAPTCEGYLEYLLTPPKTPRLAPDLIRPRDWVDTPQNPYPGDPTGHFDTSLSAGRKHPREWYLGSELPGDQYANKRFHRPTNSYDVHDGIPLQPHNLTLQTELR